MRPEAHVLSGRFLRVQMVYDPDINNNNKMWMDQSDIPSHPPSAGKKGAFWPWVLHNFTMRYQASESHVVSELMDLKAAASCVTHIPLRCSWRSRNGGFNGTIICKRWMFPCHVGWRGYHEETWNMYGNLGISVNQKYVDLRQLPGGILVSGRKAATK